MYNRISALIKYNSGPACRHILANLGSKAKRVEKAIFQILEYRMKVENDNLNRRYADEIVDEFKGNWKKFDSFAWHSEPEDSENWGHWNIDSRDSELLEESNAEVIRSELAPYFGEDCEDESHGHWAVGHIGVITVRVIDSYGQYTEAFLKVCELMRSLENYPVLDEENYSSKEYEATLNNIENACYSYDKDSWPEDYAKKLFSWFWDNKQSAVENNDGQGGYPDDKEIKEAIESLGWRTSEFAAGDIILIKPDYHWDDWFMEPVEVVIVDGDDSEDIIEVEYNGENHLIFTEQIMETIKKSFIVPEEQMKLFD